MQYTFEQFQDSRSLIGAFSEQHRDSSVNYGITFSMYRDALNTARTYSNQRCEREQRAADTYYRQGGDREEPF